MDIEPMVWLSLIFYWRFLVFATRWDDTIFPQQRKLMGSSAQNSSSVHWCRRRVRFNEVPEKVPRVPEKVWEALVQSQVRFNRLPEKVPQKFSAGRLWCGEGSGEGLGGFGAESGQVQQHSGEGSGEGLGGFGAKPGEVQQGSEESSGEGPAGGFGAVSVVRKIRRRPWTRSATYIRTCYIHQGMCLYVHFFSSLLLSFFDRGRCALRGAGRGGAA